MTRQILTKLGKFLLTGLIMGILAACGQASGPGGPTPAKELVFYSFAEDMPQSILDDFAKEFGVKVRYETYQSPEESAEQIRSGKAYDVAFVENQIVAPLGREGLLAELEFKKIPNFRNIGPNFRDLAYDPENRYSIPCDYGTTGLLVRTDLVGKGPRRWADLWNPRYAGKIGLRAQPREVIGMALVSLGYDFNTEKPQELEAALRRLLMLKPAIVLLDIEADSAVPLLLKGEIAVLHGYAEDYEAAHEANPSVSYVLPQEGTFLWGDSYVISARSTNKDMAAAFINFLQKPEIAARIVNEKKYAVANEAALPFVASELRHNSVIFPSNQDLKNRHIILSLTGDGEKRFADLWDRFIKGGE